MVRTLSLTAFAFTIGACSTRGERVCAEPLSSPVAGDANGDGRFDVADVVALDRHLVVGDAPVACEAAAEVEPVGLLDLADVFAGWHALFTQGGGLPPLQDGACAGPAEDDPAPCGRLGWAFDTTTAKDGQVRVTLWSPDLEVDGWSLGVRATGCAIAAASTSGTLAADAGAGGTLGVGLDLARTAPDGAVAAFVPDWLAPRAIAPDPDPRPVLALAIARPGSGCATCSLAVSDDVAGAAGPVASRVVHAGRSYAPPGAEVQLEVCAP
jgi:hypothetical protein